MMITALAAILVLWVGVALALAVAGGSQNRTRAAVETALASTEPIRAAQATFSDEEEHEQTWHKASAVA